MLVQYVVESVVTTKVLQNWYTYNDHVFEEMKNTHELINSLQHHRPVTNEAMDQTIDDQLVLEINKLKKIEKQEHHCISQA